MSCLFVVIIKLQKFDLMICKPCFDQTGTLANREDPEEMPHYVAFHQGPHCSLRQN